jgi:hypothetical protein
MERGIVQRPRQSFDIDPGGGPVHCEHGEVRSRLTGEFEFCPGVDHRHEGLSHDRSEAQWFIPSRGDHECITEQVVQAPAVPADDDGAIRARFQRYVESEFQIGGVLVDRVPTNLTSN